MRQSIKSLQKNLKFDCLMEFLDRQFEMLPEHRASNSRYRLASVVKAAFAMFSLKSPSLLDFKKQTSPEQNNLRWIYRIEGEIPCDNQMRVILDGLEPPQMRPLFASVFQLLTSAGVIKE